MIILCLSQNWPSVRELNDLLVLFLFLLICSVIFSVCGGPAHGTSFGVILVYFYACGTGSGVIVLYFPHMELALIFCGKFISCCNILTF